MLYALGMDGGKSLEAYNLVEGKIIDRVWKDGDAIVIESDGNVVEFFDDGQCCCENRYITCDDDLEQYAGAKLLSVETRDGPEEEDKYGDSHETQFLKFVTDKGDITACTHNEHNGYYGGFSVVARVRAQSPTEESEGE